jgi:hypothetical protein
MRGALTRECIDCGWPLPITKFGLVRNWRRTRCNKCHNIAGRYKISGKEFFRMLDNQMNCCLICESPINENNAVIDHCHNTKKVRALLCNGCNLAIGHLRHDKEIAYRAVEYLTKHT